MFITFEGIDGSGKSTQMARVAERLEILKANTEIAWLKDRKIVTTREPGGTPLAEKIRNIAVNDEMDNQTELLLMLASRNEHVNKVIKPALADGYIVLCDRFIDSTYAYQTANGVSLITIQKIQEAILGDFEPDITFYLEITPEESLKRAMERGTTSKFEARGMDYHKRVSGAYRAITTQKDRFVTIDATLEPDVITGLIMRKLAFALGSGTVKNKKIKSL